MKIVSYNCCLKRNTNSFIIVALSLLFLRLSSILQFLGCLLLQESLYVDIYFYKFHSPSYIFYQVIEIIRTRENKDACTSINHCSNHFMQSRFLTPYPHILLNLYSNHFMHSFINFRSNSCSRKLCSFTL